MAVGAGAEKSPVIAVTAAWGVLLGPCYFFQPAGSFLISFG